MIRTLHARALRYAVAVGRDSEDSDPINMAVAAPPALAPLMLVPAVRKHFPYAFVLIAMDAATQLGYMGK